MCRLFGAVAATPIDVSFELLEAQNSILRQSERHDSGWGSAYYSDGVPVIHRFPHAAHADEAFDEATSQRARLIMVHVRRATIGDLGLDNTHPFAEGPYTYCHNGTILKAAELVPLSGRRPRGDTDSERFFNLLMARLDAADVIGSLRRTVAEVVEHCRFSALNFLFCDGRLLYAYRFGVYRLFWIRPHDAVFVSSEALDDRPEWAELDQDELLVCDPARAAEPRVERLLGKDADGIEFVPLDSGRLSGAERGRWAAERAAAGF